VRECRGKRAAIATSPRGAGLHHALGLTLIRLKRLGEALGELRDAAELEPGRTRYPYVYAVGLNSAGRRDEAMAVLKEILVRRPNDRDTLSALIGFSRDAGDFRDRARIRRATSPRRASRPRLGWPHNSRPSGTCCRASIILPRNVLYFARRTNLLKCAANLNVIKIKWLESTTYR
jgi:tetratricopeptide (TPR) repeat protein